jgi:hypothetical protein
MGVHWSEREAIAGREYPPGVRPLGLGTMLVMGDRLWCQRSRVTGSFAGSQIEVP